MWWLSGSDENVVVLSLIGEGPPTAVEREDTHDKPASTDNTIVAIDTIDIAAELPSNVSDAHSSTTNRRHGLFFFCVMTAVSIGGMGVTSFGVLAGGKVGYTLTKDTLETLAYGAIDIAVAQQADPGSVWQKRGACWFTIGIFTGSVNSAAYISFDAKRAGTIWQTERLLFLFAWYFICKVGLVGGVMMRAHKDRRPNVMKWFVLMCYFHFLATSGSATPYPLITALGTVLVLLVTIFGVYFLVMKIDKGAEQTDVQNGYKLLVGLMMTSVQWFNLRLTSLTFLGPFVISAALMLFQKMVLIITIPSLKLCFGDDHRKMWSYAVPAMVLGLELGPCLLLLGSDMTTVGFWGLILMQEANSVLKNTGKFAELYVAARALLRRPVDEESLKLMEERRSTIAPCDNIGEVVSPIVIMIAIGLESLFDSLPIERAPYFADKGVLGGWRNQRFSGEAPAMLIIVFLVRVAFCWIEMKVRDRQRPNETANADFQTPQDDSGTTAGGAKKRRSSMAVLYHRIVRSDDAPVHMQYMAGALFALQLIIFVDYAAGIGKRM